MGVKGARILVAEDDRAVRQSLERTLRVEGFEVNAVHNGADAVDACHSDEPDLVILDVMMPEMDGLEVLQAVREAYSASELPVIMVTAKAQSDDVVEASCWRAS